MKPRHQKEKQLHNIPAVIMLSIAFLYCAGGIIALVGFWKISIVTAIVYCIVYCLSASFHFWLAIRYKG